MYYWQQYTKVSGKFMLSLKKGRRSLRFEAFSGLFTMSEQQRWLPGMPFYSRQQSGKFGFRQYNHTIILTWTSQNQRGKVLTLN
jgi:hypothetical protein